MVASVNIKFCKNSSVSNCKTLKAGPLETIKMIKIGTCYKCDVELELVIAHTNHSMSASVFIFVWNAK